MRCRAALRASILADATRHAPSRAPGQPAPPAWRSWPRRLRARQPCHLERRRSELQPRDRRSGDQSPGLSRRRLRRPRHAVLRPRRRSPLWCPPSIWGWRLFASCARRRPHAGSALPPGSAQRCLSAAIAGCLPPPLTWPLPTGLGGVVRRPGAQAPGAASSARYPAASIAALWRRPRRPLRWRSLPTAPASSARKSLAAQRPPSARRRGRRRRRRRRGRRRRQRWRSARSRTGGCRCIFVRRCDRRTAATAGRRARSRRARAATRAGDERIVPSDVQAGRPATRLAPRAGSCRPNGEPSFVERR